MVILDKKIAILEPPKMVSKAQRSLGMSLSSTQNFLSSDFVYFVHLGGRGGGGGGGARMTAFDQQ